MFALLVNVALKVVNTDHGIFSYRGDSASEDRTAVSTDATQKGWFMIPCF